MSCRYGLHLLEALKVPIGLVNTNWGGVSRPMVSFVSPNCFSCGSGLVSTNGVVCVLSKPWHLHRTPCGCVTTYYAAASPHTRRLALAAGTSIEAWSSPESLAQCRPPSAAPPLPEARAGGGVPGGVQGGGMTTSAPRTQPAPSQLWNAMVTPLLNMTIKGAIWRHAVLRTCRVGGALGVFWSGWPHEHV